ncbi:hypothetical protein MTQ94_03990 [Staphylococcus agnetis]|uniref:DUF3963 domain-containing protein n=1 Tax=Staphylococcus agnetis TaxID=985762 RepID=A0ABD7TU00_9STAP|nr:hypothetical protein [Staphylococcus agnetis]MCO4337814.1 hypothetical protein [Staphylococcus agnetis]MCO4340389.1 hypothetical protein [Staphylococcus agnetis]MCO4342939.1 hypothetical protein [Staphylococcus agnetis]MCO4344996.1 hypothetical protein [Staphylococcus agnetis]MCO4347350.1 hypothetical protein [Staphylococcus agnetis]
MVTKILQNYFITFTLFITMMMLSVGFVNQYDNGVVLLIVLTFVITLFNFLIETWLLKSQLSMRKIRLFQTIAFPCSIILIGLVCFVMLM